MPHLANIDGIIWLVIIVVSIIAQIVKAGKKAASNASQTESPRSATPERRETRSPAQRNTTPRRKTYQDRSDELRQFFESLGGPIQELAPAQQPQKRRKKTKTSPPPPPRPAVTRKVASRPDAHTVALETLNEGTAQQTLALRKLLQQKQTQQQAILLREILGPPLALR